MALFVPSLPGRADDVSAFTPQRDGRNVGEAGGDTSNVLALTSEPTSNSTLSASETPSVINPVNTPAGGGSGDPASFGSGSSIILDPNQPTSDFDFGSLLFGPPTGNDQQTTLAADSVNGKNANAGTLYAPKLTLQQTIANGSVFGLYRGSTFRESLPLPTSTTHGVVVQDVTLGSTKSLPIISALDPVNISAITSNGDGTYSYLWTPTDSTINNGGYDNVYMVEIYVSGEATQPVAARRRMIDVSSRSAVASATFGTVWVQPPGTGTGQSGSTTQWKAIFHPSYGANPDGSGGFRYEVVSRYEPANWGSFDSNAGDGAMSGLVLVGGSSGYGALGGPRGFAGERLAFLHASTHGAVLGGGSLQRSVFYEGGDLANGAGPAIALAWYAGTGTGLRWSTARCLFYLNVGDRYANGLIAHTAGSTSFERGDVSDCAFVGARWRDGSLHGTAIDYVNVAAGAIERVYVQADDDAFGVQMPLAAEVKNSVFRAVHRVFVGENFHDNIVQSVNGADPAYVGNRNPSACVFAQSGASAANNLFWAHTDTATGLPNDDQVSGIGFASAGLSNLTFRGNIVVLDPASANDYVGYTGQTFNAAGVNVDYNLVINLSKKGVSAEGPGPGRAYLSWSAYLAGYPGADQHSLFLDLSSDPRGLKAVFADPANGDFRWANTNIGVQCAAYCLANHVGPATVTTHWPLVPTVDDAVAAISLLPPKITNAGAVTFTNATQGEYRITTDLDGTPNAPTSYSATGQPAWLSVNASSGVISGTPPQAGNVSISVNATNMAGTGSAVLGITVQTAYMAWQKASFTAAELNNPAVSGPNATPAGDGIPNLAKYALGLDPKSSGVGALPTISFMAAGGANFLTLTYKKSLAASDVTCTVEVSGDLRTWSSGANDTATVSATTNPAGTMQTVVQRDLIPINSARQRFIRLKISQP